MAGLDQGPWEDEPFGTWGGGNAVSSSCAGEPGPRCGELVVIDPSLWGVGRKTCQQTDGKGSIGRVQFAPLVLAENGTRTWYLAVWGF